MDLSIDETLRRGIEAHQSGQLREAEHFYRAILESQPAHPDANHNLGVLAVGVGKIEDSLKFFATALNTNANISQFWLSYMDALIRLGRLKEAKHLLANAEKNAIDQALLDKLKKYINEGSSSKLNNSLNHDMEASQL